MRFVLAVIALSASPAPRSPYLGADACATCHKDVTASWRKTAHARALDRLSQRDAASPACRSCHATGDAPAGRSELPGVQCEACHGAGADYVPDDVMRDVRLARELGLRDLSTAAARARVCMRCHRRATRSTPFDPEEAWRLIAHPRAADGGR